MKAFFNFYGIRLSIHGPTLLLDRMQRDFSYFSAGVFQTPSFEIRVLPASQKPTHWRSLWKTRWSTLYLSNRHERRVCFYDSAWVAYRFELGQAEVYCDDPINAFEVCYLVVLSAMGEALDRRGVHRVHGLGLCCDGRGILFLGASGVGKSTLALEFLKDEKSRILSDDTPLLDELGGMTAFPQRIALKERPDIDERYVRAFKRTPYPEKYVIGCEYFKDRIQPSVLTDAVVYLTRGGQKESSLEELSRFELFGLLLRWLVVGHETPQIWQLYVRLSPLSLWWKVRIFASRVRCAGVIARRTRPWKVSLGCSAEHSACELKRWMSDGKLATRVLGEIG